MGSPCSEMATSYTPENGGCHVSVYEPFSWSWSLVRSARWLADWRGEMTTLKPSPPEARRVPVASHAMIVKRAVRPSGIGPLAPRPTPNA